jgi:hypothetical protein
MDLVTLKNYLNGKGDPLTLNPSDLNLPQSLRDFLNTIPNQQITLSPGNNGIQLQDSTLTIAGSSSDKWPVQGMENVIATLRDITIIIINKTNLPTISSTANATLPLTTSVQTPIIITALQQNGYPWQITLAQNATGITPTELLLLGKAETLPFKLPPELDVLNQTLTVSKNQFQITFYPNTTYEFCYSFTLSAPDARWTLIQDDILSFNGIDLKAFVMTNSVGVLLTGHLQIDGVGVDVGVSLNTGEDWSAFIQPSQGEAFPSLAALAAWIGGNSLSSDVSTGFSNVGFESSAFDVAIEKVVLGFNWRQTSLNYLNIRSLLAVRALQLDVELRLPNIELIGSLHDNQPLKAKDVLSSFGLPTADVPDSLSITAVNFNAQPKNSYYSADMVVDNIWQVGSINLEEVQLLVSYYGAGGVTGQFNCEIAIGELIKIGLVAEYAGTDLGLQFEGSTGQGQAIPIGTLITWLAEKFGATSVPDSIKNCTIKNLKIAFNTASKDFTFTCEGTVPLPDMSTAIDGTIIIDIKHQQDGSFIKLFSGTLVIDDLDFALIFEAAGKSTGETAKTFVAAYHDPQGREIKIDDLIQKISATQPSPKTGLSLTIKDALFAYQSQGTPSNSTSNYLFGIDIETGLNLSELKLPDLPLLGAPFPPDQNLKLGFQVLYARSNFTAQDIGNLNQLNNQGLSLPQKEINGLVLTALLRVGQDVKPLSLPIGLKNPSSGSGSGLTQVGPGSEPLATANSNTSSANVTTNVTAANNSQSTQWLKIQKTFGPIQVERVGVGYQNSQIQCLLDASLTAAGLTLSLDGLGAEFALSDLTAKTFNPTFHLDGIGIDYRNSALEIGGAFLQQKMKRKEGDQEIDYTGYSGLAIIRTEKLTLSAIGSYASYKNQPSLFIYAVLNYPLGGPAFFFITGFAAGFGYNRALTIPTIDNIATFPLVEEATKGDAPALTQDALTTELQKLENSIPPSVGDIFIAAGIKFTTFKQVNSFALLVVKLGQRFELDLLGLSTLVVPPTEAGDSAEPVAQAQLALKATFIPDEGLLSIQAQLTANSYILSKACHLTGGFAFFCWFKDHPSGAKAGDFVITLGGYHPQFDVPKYYPIVPRLGFNWQLNKPGDAYELLIKGQAYFALTAQALMAGGYLEATWSSGPFRAWFKAGADFLITWKPYHYDASFYIDIGASYTFDFFGTHTITVDLGADLHIWGPEFAGSATLHLSIISFTVNFGSGAPAVLSPIAWAEFKTAFLPAANQICSINLQTGLIRQIKAANGQPDRWIVNPKEFVFATNSVVPSNAAVFGATAATLPNTTRTDLAIAPVGIESNVTATQTITITYGTTNVDVSDQFDFVPIFKAVPAGLWGKPNLTADKQSLYPPSVNGERLLENTLAGFEIKPKQPVKDPDHSAWIDPATLQYDTELIPDAYSWQDFQLTDLQGKAAWDAANQTTAPNAARDQLLQALGWVNPEMDFGQPVNQGILVQA